MRRSVLLLASMGAALVLASGVALALTNIDCTGGTCRGTTEHDYITGTPEPDEIKALAGNDRVEAKSGNDVVYGKSGRDTLSGDRGRDELFGGPAHDELYGNRGRDKLYGGGGPDYIESAADGDRDYVNCGPGKDFTQHSYNDVLVNCEDGLESSS